MKIINTIPEQENVIVVIETDAKEFKNEYQKQLALTVKKIKAPGFRQGKIPINLAEKYCNIQEIIKKTLHKICDYGLDFLLNYPEGEHNEIIIGTSKNIEVKDFNADTNIAKIAYTFDAMPTIKVGNYTVLKHSNDLSSEVTDEMLTIEIDKVLQQHAEFEIVKQVATEKNIITFDFEGSLNGKILPQACANKYDLNLAKSQFIPGFAEELIGLKAGDKKTFDIKFPQDYHSEELKSQIVTFKITVHDVKNNKVSVLNDEFVQNLKLENISTVEQYKTHLNNELSVKLQEKKEQIITNEVITWIMSDVNVLSHFPKHAIQTQAQENYQNVKAQFEEQFKQIGGFAGYIKYINLTEEQVFEKILQEIISSLKIGLVLDEIVKNNNFTITAEEEASTLEFLNKQNSNHKFEPDVIKKTSLHKKALNYLKNNLKFVQK